MCFCIALFTTKQTRNHEVCLLRKQFNVQYVFCTNSKSLQVAVLPHDANRSECGVQVVTVH
jgi:hypothetical protein